MNVRASSVQLMSVQIRSDKVLKYNIDSHEFLNWIQNVTFKTSIYFHDLTILLFYYRVEKCKNTALYSVYVKAARIFTKK